MLGVAARGGGLIAARDAVMAIAYFIILVARPSRRPHFGQQFLQKTEGETFERSFAAFQSCAVGHRLIATRPDSIAILRDGARLRGMTDGSLGRTYQEFMAAGALDEDLYLDGAIEAGRRFERDPGRAWFRTRVEAGHDMRHVLTGYGIDPLGESCLMAFRFGQTGHRGAFVIAALGFVVLAFRRQERLVPAMREAVARGRQARLLDLLAWEEALDRPLGAIQHEFGIEPPRHYGAGHAMSVANPPRIDIGRTFGPLAAMHAALDRAGIGMPCGIVARLAGQSVREIEYAIERVRHQFPVLQTSLRWIDGRATLEPIAATQAEMSADALLNFAASASGEVWRYRLVADGCDTWFQATWAHCAGDGLSMLRLVQAIAGATSEETPAPISARRSSRPRRPRAFSAWLPAFLMDQRYELIRLATPALTSPRVSWLRIPPRERDTIMATVRSDGKGMAGWLAAAAAIAFAEQQGQAAGNVLLNIPITRNDLAATNGFGFGVGSLRFPVKLARYRDVAALARAIGRRLSQLGDQGWDRNLERLLGDDPRRHARFARVEANRPADPNITISWKGHHPAIGQGVLRDVACFAAGPTLHVSAHSDASGLSLSVTSRQTASERHELLRHIARLIGSQSALVLRDLDDVAPAPQRQDAGRQLVTAG